MEERKGKEKKEEGGKGVEKISSRVRVKVCAIKLDIKIMCRLDMNNINIGKLRNDMKEWKRETSNQQGMKWIKRHSCGLV